MVRRFGADRTLLPQTLAFVKAHPNVYVDMSPHMAWLDKPEAYEAALRAFLDGGIVDRIMLGSDGEPIRNIIELTEAMAFLSDEQKRGIYYDNAARFFRLDPARSARRTQE